MSVTIMEDRKLFYTSQSNKFADLLRSARKRINLLGLLRLLIFIAAIGISIFLTRYSALAVVAALLAAASLFLYMVRLYVKASWEKDYWFNLMTINENELKGLDGDYSSFNTGNEFTDPDHDFSFDIDLFGKNSLFQFLDRTCSEAGREMLAGWLKDPYTLSGDYKVRSESVREMAERVEWRHQFIAKGIMNQTTYQERRRLEEWLNEEPMFRNWLAVRVITIVFPAISIIFLVLAITGVTAYSAFIFSFLVNLLVLSFRLKKINRIHSLVSRQYRSLNTVKGLIEHYKGAEFRSEYLCNLRERLSSGRIPPLDSIGRLASIIKEFDFRLNMVTGVLLNGVLLWDFHSVLNLEKWKRDVKELIPGWFNDLAVIDALVSLSNYAYNNPGYTYPVLTPTGQFLSCDGLGHPLIMEKDRVVNSFRIENRGVINIITGANMAGKSTFLRTVAINMVLAMAGAPVCAREYRFRPVKIFSSMRTSDSLSEKESYFYAELKRLKRLKEKTENTEPLFFILDEILKGTNSQDKSEGSRLFIEKLLRARATGIIATHDVSLGALEHEYPQSIKNSCFEIVIEDDSISFDYILRDGITTRMNAAILMRQQGIID